MEPKSSAAPMASVPEKTELFIFPKVLYFVFNLMNYCLHTFQSQLIEDQWHLSLKDIAAANMLQFTSFAGSLFWTWFADKTGRFKIIISVGCVLYGLLWSTLFLSPRIAVTEDERLFLVCSVLALSGFFQASLFPILDAVVIAIVSRTGKFSKELFGRQRFWGAFGHYASTFASDFIKEHFEGYFTLVFLLGGSCITLLCLILFGIPNDLKLEVGHGHHHAPPPKKDGEAPKETAVPATATPQSKKSPLMQLLAKPAFLFFLLFMLLSGITRSFMTNYQNYFVNRKFNRQRFLTVLATVRFFSEGAVYFFNQDLGKFLGYHWMLILSQVAAALRSLGYGIIGVIGGCEEGDYYLFCIPLELLKGLNSGLVTAGAVRIASDLAPHGGANTAQGLFSGVFIGLSMFVGGFLSWRLFAGKSGNEEGMIAMGFNITGALLLVFTLVFTLKYAFVDKVILNGKK